MPGVTLRRTRVIKGHKCKLNVGSMVAVAGGWGKMMVCCKTAGEGDGLPAESRSWDIYR